MKTIGEALADVMALVTPTAREDVALADAVGRFVAETVTASIEVPPFDASLVDGYGVRAADARAGRALAVVGVSRAGSAPEAALAAGTAMRVLTGAPVPSGADAIVMQEVVTREGDVARFARDTTIGAAIRRRASDVAIGDVLLAAGAPIDPGAIGLLASQGRAGVPVHRAPRVAIVTTGDELVPAGTPLPRGAIHDANGPMLAALADAAGAAVVSVAHARDELAETVDAIARAIAAADLVLTVGGVSVGDHDLVHDALARLGVTRTLWKVRMKPGKPLAVGVTNGTPVIGLPGNPVSAWVGFEVFVRPALRKMLGDPRPYRAAREVVLGAAIRCSPDRTELARARLDDAGVAWPALQQGSSALSSATDVDVLLVLSERDGVVPEGDRVRALDLRGRGSASSPFAAKPDAR